MTLIERYPVIGGVCLNVGCIPSKALLHMAQVIHEVDEVASHGIKYGKPSFELEKIKGWKEGITKSLNTGLAALIKQRKITLVHGVGSFASANSIVVESESGSQTISFDHAIIAAGSQPTEIPVFPNDDPRLWDSTDALELHEVPKNC